MLTSKESIEFVLYHNSNNLILIHELIWIFIYYYVVFTDAEALYRLYSHTIKYLKQFVFTKKLKYKQKINW